MERQRQASQLMVCLQPSCIEKVIRFSDPVDSGERSSGMAEGRGCRRGSPPLFRDDLLIFRGEWNLFADYFVSLQRNFNEFLMRRELKQRLSESRAKRWSSESRSKLVCILPSRDRVRGTQIVWALPNRWSSESHQACLNGRVVTEVGEANVSCFDRRSNIVNGAKRMAETFGHSKDLITLSLSLSLSGARQ